MRLIGLSLLLLSLAFVARAQQIDSKQPPNLNPKVQQASPGSDSVDIYALRAALIARYQASHRDTLQTGDDELASFNRWFYLQQPRSFPSGKTVNRYSFLEAAHRENSSARYSSSRKSSATPIWQSIGPHTTPGDAPGIGRVNCITIDPSDTNTIYVGTACGGVFVSHNGGATWASNTDGFPSLSIADIAVNPLHTDTVYAATGDYYGYVTDGFGDFWGGLYSAGLLVSPDRGNTWFPTGLNYQQYDRMMIYRLLILPSQPSTLMAATSKGLFRTTDAGTTWASVDSGRITDVGLRPGSTDTVYNINGRNLKVSADQGLTWLVRQPNVNPSTYNAHMAFSPAAPSAVWVLDGLDSVRASFDGGRSFSAGMYSDTAGMQSNYMYTLGVSPVNANLLYAAGLYMSFSPDEGRNWHYLDPEFQVHVDNHCLTLNPLNPTTIYAGNDGGIFVSRDGGFTWANLSDGLTISQVYRMASSRQHPDRLLCGLQDNGTIAYTAPNWTGIMTGDGMVCAFDPFNDSIIIVSEQYGLFYLSRDAGATFTRLNISSQPRAWTTPFCFDPNRPNTMYFGFRDLYASYDGGTTFVNLTNSAPFSSGAVAIAVAPSNSNVIYVCDQQRLLKSSDNGATWGDVTNNLPTSLAAISQMAVDYRNPNLVYVSFSGYNSVDKVYVSANGGVSWSYKGTGLPNLPINCIVADSSIPGALFAGTDMGVYYTDSSLSAWQPFGTGLPNTIVSDIDINYTYHKIRVATYGRGVWETALPAPSGIGPLSQRSVSAKITAFPNPSANGWKLNFPYGKPAVFQVDILNELGQELVTASNNDLIRAAGLPPGIYQLRVSIGNAVQTITVSKQ